MANERDKVSLAEWKAGRGRTELPSAARGIFIAAFVAIAVLGFLFAMWVGLMLLLFALWDPVL